MSISISAVHPLYHLSAREDLMVTLTVVLTVQPHTCCGLSKELLGLEVGLKYPNSVFVDGVIIYDMMTFSFLNISMKI